MDQQLASHESSILGAEDSTAFQLRWQNLLARVQHRYRWVDQARIEDAIAEAYLRRLMKLHNQAETTPDQSAEESERSLYDAICHLVCNGVRGDQRRHRREQDYVYRNQMRASEEPSVDDLERLLSELNPWEQQFLALRRQGVREPSAYADMLGLTECSLEEQRQAIDRSWNRLRMKLRRRRERLRICRGNRGGAASSAMVGR